MNPKEQIDTGSINEENESSKESINTTKEDSKEFSSDEKSTEINDKYKFGWNSYPEITNGRFAMIGFLAIILIELLSNQPFLKWAGIL